MVFPAYAGMFLPRNCIRFCRCGFPRIRGDVPTPSSTWPLAMSFSPHTRGCSLRIYEVIAPHLVFPAYAGMFLIHTLAHTSNSSFPRIRGDVPPDLEDMENHPKFSPHTRGCSPKRTGYLTHFSVFPAYAGMFLPQYLFTCPYQCFPRIRGDVPSSAVLPAAIEAFSPHTRGCSSAQLASRLTSPVFPTYAGMFHRL